MTANNYTNGEEARKAAEDAQKGLTKQNSLWSAIRQRIAGLVQLSEENHFSDKIVDSFRSHP